jgi:uncharacterized linocin/CFP29 family protein
MSEQPSAVPAYQQPGEHQTAPITTTATTPTPPPGTLPPSPPPATLPAAPMSAAPSAYHGLPPAHPNGSAIQNRGRDKIHWTKEIWDHLDMAVHDECMRTRVAAKYLPIHKVPDHYTTIPADSISGPADEAGVIGAFAVDEGAVLRIPEKWVEFSMTPQQLEQETQIEQAHRGHSTAVTLATRAANLLMQAEDTVIFQGLSAFGTRFFTDNIRFRGTPDDFGLLDIIPDDATSPPPELPQDQVIQVPNNGTDQVYGEETFKAVARGYAILQDKGQYGPYALTLHTIPYADAHAPLATTLIMPADRIKPIMTAGFYGSGTLVAHPEGPEPLFTGSLVNVGGNTMDLVVGLDATTAFMQQDVDGNYRFRVVERVALRIKDIRALIRLEFQ